MVSQKINKHYSGIANGIADIIKNDGVLKLWRGVTPAIILMTLTGATTFGSLTVFEEKLGTDSPAKTLGAGFLSGATSKLTFYPLDVIKKRLQVQGFKSWDFNNKVVYTGVLDCGKRIFRNEGLNGFYKGVLPSLMKTGIQTGLIIAVYKWSPKPDKEACKKERWL
ncbi:hypothetical protein ACOME3_010281 [Neoechinorhynchus agilis]